ncbi:A24 family peptidase [Gemmobacter serpentinus]|uniref:A24 family peptidase n=1 Tax=Gemmobacter serpentinus TaxID=2652247 RepID=UPI00124C53AB|nr:prepilin peptidase [Gemmobacter serpentinus]
MLTFTQAAWLLPFCVPLAIWIAITDMRRMKIPNIATLAMIAVYAVIGFVIFPLETWLWGWLVMAIAMVIGFLGNAIGLFGAGDAKFGAAMAPIFITGDLRLILTLICGAMFAALVVHRIARAIPAVRRATPDWESWTRKDFPFGLALAGTLIFYLLAAILAQ